MLTRSYTIMLYGHNMKSGMMFGNLRKYEDQILLLVTCVGDDDERQVVAAVRMNE